MPKKEQLIDYTSRDFDSIRRDLEEYARRYYPESYKDFNQASFGSLMLDTVSYVGDILSFYLDYQANESFFVSSIEYNNVIRHARSLGWRLPSSPSSYGVLTFYIQIPTAATGVGPDRDYTPILQAGSVFNSNGGGSYTLIDDVNFASAGTQVVVGSVDASTGNPLNYVVRAQGRAVSGRTNREAIEIGDFQRFLSVQLSANNVSEVIKVVDANGNEYFEVDNLSQNTIYKAVRNTTNTRTSVTNLLKAVPVPRRFVLENQNNQVTLQFGYGSKAELTSNSVTDPSELLLQLNGRNYITDRGFDPTKLIATDKFGIAPSNTTLIIDYRHNTVQDVNAAVNTVVIKGSPRFKFNAGGALNKATRQTVVSSMEVTNEVPFVGSISLPSADEIKQRALGYFSTQHRAVTLEDYKYMTYSMPASFGAIHRCAVNRDLDEFRRNVNLYIISIDHSGKLVAANSTLKNNLKTWISQYKMINDTIDIADAVIVNFGVKYQVISDFSINKYTLLNNTNRALTKHFSTQYDIGESINITDIVQVLQGVEGVLDVTDVKFELKDGGIYAASSYDFEANISGDGRLLKGKSDVIFELKFPHVDIEGAVK